MRSENLLRAASCGLVLLPVAVRGQEALRNAVAGDRAYEGRQRAAAPPAPPQGRIQAGPVAMSIGASLGLEWNDNVRISRGTPIEDFSLTPGANLNAVWPISQTSLLAIGFGIGYQKYIDHSEYDQLRITPDSEIALDLPIKDVTLTISDRISYSEDVVSQPELSGVATYPRLENYAGLRATWLPGDWLLQAGYGHFNFLAFSSDYDYLDRNSEQFFARGAYQVGPGTRAGLEATAALTAYDRNLRNDYTSYSFGPYVDWTVYEGLRLTARGGYTGLAFDDTAITPPPADVNSYYLGLTANHRLTDFITHDLTVLRDVQSGIESEYLETFTLAYGMRWQATDHFDLSLAFAFERGKQGSGIFPETYERYTPGLSAGYAWTDHLRTSLSYSFSKRDSDQTNRDYDQNRVSFVVAYQF